MRARSFPEGRPLCAAAAVMCLGVWAGKTAGWMPGAAAAGVALGAVLAYLLARMGTKPFPGVMIAVFFVSMMYAGWASRPYENETGGVVAEGYVTGETARRDDGSFRVALRDVRAVDTAGRSVRLGKVYWTFRPYDDEEIERFGESLFDGDRVTFAATVYRPSGRVNPHGFDFSLYLRQHGFDSAVSGCSSPSVVREAGVTLSGRVLRARLALSASLERIFGESAAWPQALILGERDRLSEDTREAFSALGIAHILAVSGLHVGLIGAMLLLVMRKAAASPRVRLCVLACFLLFYCALLEFSAPVCRASILMLLGEGRRVLRRSSDPLTALSAALILLLILSPLSLFSAGFLMTFSAVGGIALLSAPISRMLRFLPSKRVRDALGASWGAAAGVALPVAGTYHTLALAGLVLSPPVCLGMGILLPAYLAIWAVGCVWTPAGQALAGMLHACLSPLTEIFASWSESGFGAVRTPAFPLPAAAALCVIVAVSSDYVLMKTRTRFLAAGCAAAVALSAVTLGADPRVRYLQFSVGQGDCAALLDGRETVIIDCGEDGGDLKSFLLSEGRRADTVVLTHLHSDHCGGLIALMENGIGIGRVLLPEGAEAVEADSAGYRVTEMLRERAIPIEWVRAGDTFGTERARFEVLWPEENAPRPMADANDYSMALLCETGGVRLLLAGDLSGTYEMYAARDADILKAAHHGSNASTSGAFLDIVTPKIALITARSGAKLPGEETLARLEERGCAVYRTDECGCVTVFFGDGGAKVNLFLEQR